MWKRYIAFVLCFVLATSAGSSAVAGVSRPYRATYYTGGLGACGVPLTGHYVAVNSRPGAKFPCGTRVRLTYQGKTVTGYVADRMGAYPQPGCKCVDLAPTLFKKLGVSLSTGVFHPRVVRL